MCKIKEISFLSIIIISIFSMTTPIVWAAPTISEEGSNTYQHNSKTLPIEQLSKENISVPPEQNLESRTSSEQQLPWGNNSELILRVSEDGKTLHVPGGAITNPVSLSTCIGENGLSPENITKIVIDNPLEVSGNMSYLFAFFENLQYIENIENVDVSSISLETNEGRMDSVFAGDNNLQELNLSTWDLTNYKSDMSGMFYACWNLKKLVLGPNFKTSTVQGLTDPPQDSPAYTGYWRAVGNGTEHRPEGKRWNATEFMSSGSGDWTTVVGDGWTDTHVWEPVPAKIKVKYVDTENNEIHDPIENNEVNVSEDYDVTMPEYKLILPGYTLDDSKLPENAKGHISDSNPVLVTYIYKKNPVVEGSVTAHYEDCLLYTSPSPRDA